MNWGTTLWICLLGGSSHKLETAYSNWDDPPRKGTEKKQIGTMDPICEPWCGCSYQHDWVIFWGICCSFHGTFGYSMSIVPTQNARRILMLITNTVQGLKWLKHAKHLRAQGLGRFIMESFSQLILRDHFHWRCAKKKWQISGRSEPCLTPPSSGLCEP